MEKTRGGVQEISEKLSNEFQRVLPLHPQPGRQQKKLTESEIKAKSEAALQGFYELARKEVHSHSLGVLARARVAFNLQQRLLGKGYEPALVKQVLFAMLVSVFVGRK